MTKKAGKHRSNQTAGGKRKKKSAPRPLLPRSPSAILRRVERRYGEEIATLVYELGETCVASINERRIVFESYQTVFEPATPAERAIAHRRFGAKDRGADVIVPADSPAERVLLKARIEQSEKALSHAVPGEVTVPHLDPLDRLMSLLARADVE